MVKTRAADADDGTGVCLVGDDGEEVAREVVGVAGVARVVVEGALFKGEAGESGGDNGWGGVVVGDVGGEVEGYWSGLLGEGEG